MAFDDNAIEANEAARVRDPKKGWARAWRRANDSAAQVRPNRVGWRSCGETCRSPAAEAATRCWTGSEEQQEQGKAGPEAAPGRAAATEATARWVAAIARKCAGVHERCEADRRERLAEESEEQEPGWGWLATQAQAKGAAGKRLGRRHVQAAAHRVARQIHFFLQSDVELRRPIDVCHRLVRLLVRVWVRV